MGIIKRIATGTTTVRDAQKVQDLHGRVKRFPLIMILLTIGGILVGFALAGLLHF